MWEGRSCTEPCNERSAAALLGWVLQLPVLPVVLPVCYGCDLRHYRIAAKSQLLPLRGNHPQGASRPAKSLKRNTNVQLAVCPGPSLWQVIRDLVVRFADREQCPVISVPLML